MQGFKNRDIVAFAGQLAGAGQPGRSGADDRHAETGGRADQLLHIQVFTGPVGDEALQMPHGDRFALLAADAELLALLLLRADAAGDAGQRVGAEEQLGGAAQVAGGDFLEEAGNIDADGTAADALAVFALQAAVSLKLGEGHGKAQVNLAEIAIALHGLALRHVLPGDCHTLFGGHRHGTQPQNHARINDPA